MRILTVSHFYEGHGGGIERVAGRLCAEFAAAGHQPSWAAAHEAGLAPPPPVEAVPLACLDPIERLTGLPMPVPTPSALRALTRAVRASDVVVVHDSLYLTSIAALAAARWAGKPVLLIQHIAAIPFASRVLRGAMGLANALVTRRVLGQADQVVFISATTAAAFAKVPFRRPALTLFNGVDGDIFSAVGGDPAGTRAGAGLPAEGRLLLFVGRFVAKKGLSVLQHLARSRPDLHLAMAGSGPIDPEAWGLPNVTVVRGRSGAALADLYRAADLLVLPSVGEGYPLVVQEAMACGLPVLCGLDSFQADPGAQAWTKGIPVCLEDPAGTARRFSDAIDAGAMPGSERLAMAGYAARAYSWPRMARRLLSAIPLGSAAGRAGLTMVEQEP